MEPFGTQFMSLIRYHLFNYFQTGNILLDSIITTIIFSFFGFMVVQIEQKVYPLVCSLNLQDLDIINGWKKSSIQYEGLMISSTFNFDFGIRSNNDFSDTLLALIDYIFKNQLLLKDIQKLKEIFFYNRSDEHKGNKSMYYLVNQTKPFVICNEKQIYAHFLLEMKEVSEKDKNTNKKEKIVLTLYSYKSSMVELLKFSHDIKVNYLSTIKKSRINKLFIYKLIK